MNDIGRTCLSIYWMFPDRQDRVCKGTKYRKFPKHLKAIFHDPQFIPTRNLVAQKKIPSPPKTLSVLSKERSKTEHFRDFKVPRTARVIREPIYSAVFPKPYLSVERGALSAQPRTLIVVFFYSPWRRSLDVLVLDRLLASEIVCESGHSWANVKFKARYSTARYANAGCHINKSGNVIEFRERELRRRIHFHDNCQWHSTKSTIRRHRINFGWSRGGWQKLAP
ncbi:hypothetical protein CEXT_243741 [Caerostris extrusa]|uniref:Uncharacterized protein n=1 Tax=Caerostris extrusa TaxID=172846 RepID=A0AAV4VHJ0_CAEEX|nr:hypothetical protein CEXT_243741 [Caerostris extrusa]